MNSDSTDSATVHREQPTSAASGWFLLFVALVLIVLGLITIIGGARTESIVLAFGGVLFLIAGLVTTGGFFTLQPNEAAVFTLFGAYRGTTRQNGFLWANPFYRKQKISLRVRNLNGEKLKVNDKRGNPVEIAVVIVWRIKDTAQAMFDVDSRSEERRVGEERRS